MFIRHYMHSDFEEIGRLWLLDEAHARAMGEYLLYVNQTFVVPVLRDLALKGHGPIAIRRVSEWTFNFSDPFLALLGQPFYRHASMFVNASSEQWCRNHVGISLIKTGKHDVSQVGDSVMWNGTSVISDVWAQQIAVHGPVGPQFDADLLAKAESEPTDSGPSPPSLPLWYPPLLRTVSFIPDNVSSADEGTGPHNNTFTLKGISVKRYRLDPDVFSRDPTFFQSLPGFANLSSVGSIPIFSAPIFLSKSHFWECDDIWWRDRLANMSAPSAEHDESWLEIEPITGVAMNERMAQQANIYIPPSKEQRWFDTFGALIPTDTMYPLAWVRETSVIPDERAAQFQRQLYLPMTIANVVSIISLVIGCSLVLMGTALIVVNR